MQGTGIKLPYPLSFHQTFKPERSHISSLLSIDKGTFSKEEISHSFSIPTGKVSGKVEVNLLYAQAARVIQFTKSSDVFNIKRTSLGNIVYDNDNYLEEYLTKLLFHFMYCKNNSELLLWEMLFRDYHMGLKQFKEEEFKRYAKNQFGGEKNIKLAPLLGTYIGDNALINFGLLNSTNPNSYSFGRVDIIGSYVYWYSYFLGIFLQEIDPNRQDFTFDEILKNGFTLIFGWNGDELKKILVLIENTGIISLNKQFSNFHIYLHQDPKELISYLEYY